MMSEDVKTVVNALISMLHNNVINDNGMENFVNWCEDGDIFDNEKQVSIMHQLARWIDSLSMVIESVNEHETEEEI